MNDRVGMAPASNSRTWEYIGTLVYLIPCGDNYLMGASPNFQATSNKCCLLLAVTARLVSWVSLLPPYTTFPEVPPIIKV